MITIVRQQSDMDKPEFTWVKLALMNDRREAMALDAYLETADIAAYVATHGAALKQRILAEGKVDDRLTAKLRAREAKRLLRQSRLEGKTLEQVQNYIENNVKDLATAKAALKEMAGQTWMLYQVAQLLLEALDV